MWQGVNAKNTLFWTKAEFQIALFQIHEIGRPNLSLKRTIAKKVDKLEMRKTRIL